VIVLTFDAPSKEEAVEGASVYSDLFLSTRQQNVTASTRERQGQLEIRRDQLNDEITARADAIADEEAKGDDASAGQLAILVDTQQSAIAQLAEVEAELSTLDVDVDTGRIIIDPQTAVSRAGFSRGLLTLSGLLVGALIGLILALLRDRYDDRYGSAADPGRLGLREIARVPYLEASHDDSDEAMLAYSRMITRLAFAKRGQPEFGRSILLVPIESSTMPDDAAERVADALHRCGEGSGVAIGVWSGDSNSEEHARAYWEATIVGVQELRSNNDLVLVPERALDQSAIGIGLAALVNDTILVVSDSTQIRSIQLALEDLRGVNVDHAQIVVLTGVKGRQLRRRPTPRRDVIEVEARSEARALAGGTSSTDV
jgi:hypothetical protein